ncbi:MAG TPA: TetR/AcrR family transcriptional regulator [Ramlibacter sp.]|uniref:TetR/AcrR family transcriptional regulator n=1 Tax=Ramlibacter sp. TaxID=1917967 RepID=UPI002D7E7098|nr:TetR/AcrR family transcriptional regulator [Ramlibacter sp.]HET8745027.1 TetR/AcrR family transcriptional regulator [Ramlibacter sp.]
MKAKSAVLSSKRPPPAAKPANGKRRATARLPAPERRAQIQSKAFEFFSEYGLTAQTRALAEACGVSQRLLYSAFPNKAALINAVYEAEIAGPFKAIWFVQLRDRNVPLAERLKKFYGEYYDTILTRRWLRLFLYASLAEVEIAPTYIAAIIGTLLQTIVEEAAFDCGREVPADPALVQEIGWTLHGNISHLAIRRHIYANSSGMEVKDVIALHVNAFLAIVPTVLAPKREEAK